MVFIPWLYASLITLLFYFLTRVQFLYLNFKLYTGVSSADIFKSLLIGFRFDLSTIVFLGAPVFLAGLFLFFLHKNRYFRFFLLLVFWALQLPMLVLNIIDAEFIHFIGRRTTKEALFLFLEVPGKFWDFYFSYLVLSMTSTVVVVLGLVSIYYLLPISKLEDRLSNQLWWKRILFGFVGLILCVIAARGGLQSKPLSFAHAQVFPVPALNNLLTNSGFTVLQSLEKNPLAKDQFFDSSNDLLVHLNAYESELAKPPQLKVSKPNIVVIVLESFSKDMMGYGFTDGITYTPYLDELASKSYFFNHSYANGRRSIEGIGAILSGIPALMSEPFINSQYQTNYFWGVGTLLSNLGYRSHFFHGGHNGTMYFDQFTKTAGIQSYWGFNEYPNASKDSDGTWGVWDEPFLVWTSSQLSNSSQPFFATVFTLSSHHPFKVPDQYQNKFPKGSLDIHQVIGYTDYSLKQFFHASEKADWYQNTVFIITADHTFKATRSDFDNEVSRYKVPIMIYDPNRLLPANSVETGQVVSHVDLLPTILDMAGHVATEQNYLGRSLLRPKANKHAVFYNGYSYYLVGDRYFIKAERQGKDSFKFTLFALGDVQERQPLGEAIPEFESMKLALMANLQYFSQGLWDNRLYYPVK